VGGAYRNLGDSTWSLVERSTLQEHGHWHLVNAVEALLSSTGRDDQLTNELENWFK
jgi:hypothetical protein